MGTDEIAFVNRGVARLVRISKFVAVVGEGVDKLLEVHLDLLATPDLPLIGCNHNGISSVEVCGCLQILLDHRLGNGIHHLPSFSHWSPPLARDHTPTCRGSLAVVGELAKTF